jgi:hypothetical protein
MPQTRYDLAIHGYDEDNASDTAETRSVTVLHDPAKIVVILGSPGAEDHDLPDLCIEWQPKKGWCVYAHGHGSDEVQVKLVMNPDSVQLESV